MPGVTVDGTDPLAVYETVSEAVERARGGHGPTLVESKVYRLSAHGNLIAPPGVPLHYPEHEAITVLRQPRGVRGRPARRPGAPVPRAPASSRARSTPRAPTRSPRSVTDEMDAAVQFGLDSPFPEPEAATNFVYA